MPLVLAHDDKMSSSLGIQLGKGNVYGNADMKAPNPRILACTSMFVLEIFCFSLNGNEENLDSLC